MKRAQPLRKSTARMAWTIQVRKKTRMMKTRSARFVAYCSCFGVVLTVSQEGHGFVVDEDEDDEEVNRKERRRRKKRKNREEDEALDDEDLDLIGIDVEPRETQQVRALCCLLMKC